MLTKETRQNLWNGLAITALTAVVLLIGFYFGYRFKENQTSLTDANQPINTQEINQTGQNSNSIAPVSIRQVEGVSFIKINQSPECPPSHNVKGVFDSNHGYYYTPNNKNYDRVRPDICFASEEFARDTAGFIKKF